MYRKKLIRFLMLGGSALIIVGILADAFMEIFFIPAGIMLLTGAWFNSRSA